MAPNGRNGLTRTSSLVLSSPTKSSSPAKRPSKIAVEVLPDGEEESPERARLYEVDIDLSSESDDDRTKEAVTFKETTIVADDCDPFLSSARKITTGSTRSPKKVIEESKTDDDSDDQPLRFPRRIKSRRAVVSDSEDETEIEEHGEVKDEKDLETDDDGAVLISIDPSSRKSMARDDGSPSKAKGKKPSFTPSVHLMQSGDQVVVAGPSQIKASAVPRPQGTPGTQAKLPDYFTPKGKLKKKEGSKQVGESGGTIPSPSAATLPVTPARSKRRAKRKTKKELEQEKQAYLAAYAQALFNELNQSVFMNRLPKETPLIWNKRLLATAGRARWHRDSNSVVTTSIELATKVLDCEERIRNTLSHEMCHLACWVINCNTNENHGGVWQGWVDEVMENRHDIVISTKHQYDIQYKYEWQCQTATCKKIYGRHSNSIDPDKSVCGVCKVGELVPLFKKRARNVKATSNMAADKPRDSPIQSVPRPTGPATPTLPSPKIRSVDGVILIASGVESEDGTLSGADTDAEGPPDIVKPKGRSQGALQPKASNDIGPRRGTDAADVRKIVKHMSIIDLTDD